MNNEKQTSDLLSARGMRVAWGAATHVGHIRQVNEDQYVAQPPVFLVADGMGGHELGEVASGLLADEFTVLARSGSLAADQVATAVRRSNDVVRRAGSRAARSMGTTVVALALIEESDGPMWLIVNAGDSRAYICVDGTIEQLSVDHSLVQEMVDEGQITSAEARTHPDRNVVTRAIGVDDEIVADFILRQTHGGDRFLLCSDGVHGEIDDKEILSVLSEFDDPQDAATALIERVLSGNARDNLTAVVVDTSSEDELLDPSEDTNPLSSFRTNSGADEITKDKAESDPKPNPIVGVNPVPKSEPESKPASEPLPVLKPVPKSDPEPNSDPEPELKPDQPKLIEVPAKIISPSKPKRKRRKSPAKKAAPAVPELTDE